jgi:glycosyltransferase involved in cell wall biosynthesis
MKVLFVSSGNSKFGISPIVENQGESLKKNGVDIDYFTINGKGLKGYLRSIPLLKKRLQNTYDIVHAHYSLSCIVASLAGAKPLVASLMGSDIQAGLTYNFLIRFFNKFFWKAAIVKSEYMKTKIRIKNAYVIPNGVNFKKFQFIDRNQAKKKVNFNEKKHIIFVSHPERYEKNFGLAKAAFDLLNDKNAELNIINSVTHDLIPFYMYAADVLILTSLWEGSPNVIKEAMACNLPIVSTDVGDVKEVIGNTEGCYITSFKAEDVAEKIKLALDFGKRTEGRKDIEHLDENKIAQKIIAIYKEVMILDYS